MPTSENRKLAAILFADMNERFPTEGRDESPVRANTVCEPQSGWEGQAREPRSGRERIPGMTNRNNGR